MLYHPPGEMTDAEKVCYDAGWLTPLEAVTLRDHLTDCAMALSAVLDIARETHAAWDADQDSRVGKLLIALCDPSLKYRSEITAIHETKSRIDAALNHMMTAQSDDTAPVSPTNQENDHGN